MAFHKRDSEANSNIAWEAQNLKDRFNLTWPLVAQRLNISLSTLKGILQKENGMAKDKNETVEVSKLQAALDKLRDEVGQLEGGMQTTQAQDTQCRMRRLLDTIETELRVADKEK